MSGLKHSTHSVTIDAPYDKAFDYLADWRNQPEWAIYFVKGIRKEGQEIIMTTPNGDVPVQSRTNRDLGTIDIIFPGNSVLPTRLTAIGDQLVYTFTFSVPTELPSEAFEEARRNIEAELDHLKRILEGR